MYTIAWIVAGTTTSDPTLYRLEDAINQARFKFKDLIQQGKVPTSITITKVS